jgi:hypothetical protein
MRRVRESQTVYLTDDERRTLERFLERQLLDEARSFVARMERYLAERGALD